jgi:hypothetical protein
VCFEIGFFKKNEPALDSPKNQFKFLPKEINRLIWQSRKLGGWDAGMLGS